MLCECFLSMFYSTTRYVVLGGAFLLASTPKSLGIPGTLMRQMIGFKFCNFQLLSFETRCQEQSTIISGRHEVTRNKFCVC
jgi:hypothetical protein